MYYVACLLLGMFIAECFMLYDINQNKEKIKELRDELRAERKRVNNLSYLVEKTFVEITIGNDDGK